LAKPKKDETKTKEVSRSHKIIVNNNMVSIVGGKWTTYRKMAQDVVDAVIKNFDFNNVASKTKSIELHGNISKNTSLPQDHLRMYGSDQELYTALENEDPQYESLIHASYPYTKGQVIWSIRHEMARTVEDFLARRIRLLLLDAKAAIEAAPVVAETMADELDRTDTWKGEQIAKFTKLANNYLLK